MTNHKAAILMTGVLTFGASLHAADQKVDFNKDIKPLLEKSCIECHGPEKKKGGLRLHTKAEAFKEDYVIVAGKPDESEFYKRVILPADDDDIMPPDGGPLDKKAQELIRNWIAQGAVWPEGASVVEEKMEDPTKDPFHGLSGEATPAEAKAIEALAGMGIAVRPIARNVPWTQANFRSLEGASVSDALAQLAKVKTLTDLNLANQKLTDKDLAQLKDLTNLTRLHLEKTPITDAGLPHLSKLVHLQYLNLYGTQVGDAGLDHLKGLPKLKKLYLWQTKVTDAGVDKLTASNKALAVIRGWDAQPIAKAEPAKEEKKPEAKKPAEKKAEPKKAEEKKEAPKKAEEKKPEAKPAPEKKDGDKK